MQPSIRLLNSCAVFLVTFLCLNHIGAAPLHATEVSSRDVDARDAGPDYDDLTDGDPITHEEYVDYLKKYYPETEKYLFYSGGSKQQLLDFKAVNSGYCFYDDFFNATQSEHYKDAFPLKPNPVASKDELWRQNNGDWSSMAIGEVATKDIRVFGAAHHQRIIPSSTGNYLKKLGRVLAVLQAIARYSMYPPRSSE